MLKLSATARRITNKKRIKKLENYSEVGLLELGRESVL
jgi:hypothetical protein